jgi:hypothetical protein
MDCGHFLDREQVKIARLKGTGMRDRAYHARTTTRADNYRKTSRLPDFPDFPRFPRGERMLPS